MYKNFFRNILYFEMKEKKRDSIIGICLFLMVFSIWTLRIIEIEGSEKIAMVFDFILLGIVTIVSIEERHYLFGRWEKLTILTCGFAISTISMGIYLKMLGHIGEGGSFILVVLFLFSMKSDERDYNYWIKKMTSVMYYNFIVVLSLSLLIAPWAPFTYRGIFYNQNFFAIFLVACLILFIYAMLVEKKLKYTISSGVAISLIILTESRSAQLAVILTVLIWLLYIAVKIKKEKETSKKIAIAMGKILIIGIIVVPVAIMSLKYISGTIIKLEETFFGDSFVVYELQSDKDIYLAGGEEEEIDIRLVQESSDFSTGRMELWKLYGEKIGLVGHTSPIEYMEKERSAHNTYIQISYATGLVSGILILMINLLAGYRALRLFLKEKSLISALVLTIVGGYGLYTLVETIYFPFYQHLALIFWMLAVPILMKGEKGEYIYSDKRLSNEDTSRDI